MRTRFKFAVIATLALLVLTCEVARGQESERCGGSFATSGAEFLGIREHLADVALPLTPADDDDPEIDKPFDISKEQPRWRLGIALGTMFRPNAEVVTGQLEFQATDRLSLGIRAPLAIGRRGYLVAPTFELKGFVWRLPLHLDGATKGDPQNCENDNNKAWGYQGVDYMSVYVLGGAGACFSHAKRGSPSERETDQGFLADVGAGFQLGLNQLSNASFFVEVLFDGLPTGVFGHRYFISWDIGFRFSF